MKTLMEQILKEVNPAITPEQIQTYQEKAETELNNQLSLKENELRKALNVDQLTSDYNKAQAIAKKALRDVGGLTAKYSNSEVEKKDLKELEQEALANIKALTDAAAKANDETLKNDYVKLKDEKIELETKYNTALEESKKAIAEKEKEYGQKMKTFENNLLVEKKIGDPAVKVRDPGFLPIAKKESLELLNNFTKDENGILKALDGSHATITVEGKPVVVTKEDEVIEFVLKQYAPVDNKGGGGPGAGISQPQNPLNPGGEPPADWRIQQMNDKNAERFGG